MADPAALCSAGPRAVSGVSLVLPPGEPECMLHTNEHDGGRLLAAWVAAAKIDPLIATGAKKGLHVGALTPLKNLAGKAKEVPATPDDIVVTLSSVSKTGVRTKVTHFRGAEGRREVEMLAKGTYELCFESAGVDHQLFELMVTVEVAWSSPYERRAQGPRDESHVDDGKRPIDASDAKELSSALSDLSDEIGRLKADARYLNARQRRAMRTLESNSARACWVNFLESAALVGIALAQAIFLRFLFNRSNHNAFSSV